MWRRWSARVTALWPGAVFFGVGIDLLGRGIPLEPGPWMLGPVAWWWGAFAVAASMPALLRMGTQRLESPQARRWIPGLAWGGLLLFQGTCLAGSVGGFGGWMRLGLAFVDAGGGMLGLLIEIALTLSCAACFAGVVKQVESEPNPVPPRIPRPRGGWPLWLAMGLGAMAYTIFCMAMGLEAWGRRGEVKPRWFEIASLFAVPGMGMPVLGPAGIGAAVGGVVVWLGRTIAGAFTSNRHR